MNSTRSRRKHHLQSAGHSPHVSSESVRATSVVLIRRIVFAVGSTMVFGLLILLLSVLIAHRSSDPNSLCIVLSLASLYATAFFAGIVSSDIIKGSPLICGIGAGGILLLFSFLFALTLPATGYVVPKYLPTLRWLSPLFSLLGSYLFTKKNPSRRRRHK